MARGEHPNSRAALIPFQRKKGDPPLNKTGRNQWSVLRERARERLATDLDGLGSTFSWIARVGAM
jgi:hypothetical protein